MKTFISFLIVSIGLFSCTNESPKEHVKIEEPKLQVADSIQTFSIINSAGNSIVENGESIQRYKNGVIKMQGMMKNGKREGVWKSWYENGSQWSETEFKDGKKNGKTTTWYDNEKKRYEGFYTNEIESGKWTFWNEAGEVVSTKDY